MRRFVDLGLRLAMWGALGLFCITLVVFVASYVGQVQGVFANGHGLPMDVHSTRAHVFQALSLVAPVCYGLVALLLMALVLRGLWRIGLGQPVLTEQGVARAGLALSVLILAMVLAVAARVLLAVG